MLVSCKLVPTYDFKSICKQLKMRTNLKLKDSVKLFAIQTTAIYIRLANRVFYNAMSKY
jgi:hypothetical protein